jgi:hypothetical protein
MNFMDSRAIAGAGLARFHRIGQSGHPTVMTDGE